ncbi:MAG: DUF6599 family protein [Pyrinomonadaceae bacterium]
MRFLLSIICLLAAASVLPAAPPAPAGMTIDAAARSLPEQIEKFRARGPAVVPIHGLFADHDPEDFGAISHAARTYASENGNAFYVDLVKTLSDSGAYALLSAQRTSSEEIKLGVIGTACIIRPEGAHFFRGTTFVMVTSTGKPGASQDDLLNLGRSLARGLDASDDDIPVLLKHLPYWQTAQPWAHYAVSSNSLKQDVPNQPIINEMSFEGGTEAVAAYYGPSYLVIVEFTTPQLAGDNDRRITPRIQELRDEGQPVPSAYRRVGNYSVFVFNAPDEKTATQLIDQVKYEQVVQWLGDDPYWWEKAQKIYMRTTGGVLIAVLQSSGISFLVCLTVGGIIGAVLFKRRRTRQAAEGYSDAGGMVRLNIDELTEETNRRKLLSRGEP